MSDGSAPRLALRGITKQYPGVLANDHVDLTVMPGEIHALLGENGAGKSTLMKITYGVIQPNEGEIRVDGQRVVVDSPHKARRLGIGMVFQHFTLFDALTVLENVALGLEADHLKGLRERIGRVAQAYGLPLEPDRPVYTLSVGERQRIEIVRCLLQEPRLVIMDEPTSVLTPQEADKLFETLRRLAAEGVSILYISHKLDEIRRLCDRATIMRGGRVVGSADPRQESARSLAQLMVGSEVREPSRAAGGRSVGQVRFAVSNLSLAPAEAHGIPLRDISLELRAGEVLGVAGVAGNGQGELLAALSGERTGAPDAIRLDARPVGNLGPAARRGLGLCYVPEERNGHGAVGPLSLVDKALLSGWKRKRFARGGLIGRSRGAAFAREVVKRLDVPTAGRPRGAASAREVVKRFDVRTAGVTHAASSLSGGNLQKFIVGREVMQDPDVLVVAQPTWGVDAAAAASIHQALLDLAAGGAAVLVISQDLDELFTLSDRIAVINAGRLSPAVPAAQATVEQVGLMMGGLHEAATPKVHAHAA